MLILTSENDIIKHKKFKNIVRILGIFKSRVLKIYTVIVLIF